MVAGKILVAEHSDAYVLKFIGDVRLSLCSTLDAFVVDMFKSPNFSKVLIDLRETEGIDSTSLGLLAKLSIQSQKHLGDKPTIFSPKDDITKLLTQMGFDEVFYLHKQDLVEQCALSELPLRKASEQQACAYVLEAHQVLMSLNEDNRETFKDLVSALEAERIKY